MSTNSLPAPSTPSIPMRALLVLRDEDLDAARNAAHQLFTADRLAEAEILCRGLLAADPSDPWAFILYVGTLFRMGRLHDALATAEEGLRHHPGLPRLTAMRGKLLELFAKIAALPDEASLSSTS